MIRSLVCAIAFLTRAPLPARLAFTTADVGRAMLWFPLVGALLGALALAEHHVLADRLPPTLIAILLLGTIALATGALHLDGLADMADGFGGGRTREDVLRIMRDHVIGAYGACALIFVIGVQVAALAALLAAGDDRIVVLAPALGRWGAVPVGAVVPYARKDVAAGGAVIDHVGAREVLGATLTAGALAIGLCGWRGVALWAVVGAITALQARWCVRKIGGVTGDTTGANIVVCEAAIYVVALALR